MTDYSIIIVNKSEKVVPTREISSNPLSNVSWYNGRHFLIYEFRVNMTSFIIDKAKCTDTTNFTLIASNASHWNVTASIELIVNCK